MLLTDPPSVEPTVPQELALMVAAGGLGGATEAEAKSEPDPKVGRGPLPAEPKRQLTVAEAAKKLRLEPNAILAVFVLGSRLWRTHTPNSDWDLMIVTRAASSKTSVHSGDGWIDATLIAPAEYERRCRNHAWLETITRWLPPSYVLLNKMPPLKLKLRVEVLAQSVAKETTRDWQRARKYILRGDLQRGKNTLCHALRMNVLAVQLARKGAVTDFTAANGIFRELRDVHTQQWQHYNDRYGQQLCELQAKMCSAYVEPKLEPEPGLVLKPEPESKLTRPAMTINAGRTSLQALARSVKAEPPPSVLQWARKRGQRDGGMLSEVAPALFLGNRAASRDRGLLCKHGITAVVCVGARPVFGDLSYHHVKIKDDGTESMRWLFRPAADFIASHIRGGGVLVHCQGGMSRSPSMLMAYLLLHCGLSLPEAAEAVMLARPAVKPRPNFLLDLQALQAELAPEPERESQPKVAAAADAIALERQRSREARDVVAAEATAAAAAGAELARTISAIKRAVASATTAERLREVLERRRSATLPIVDPRPGRPEELRGLLRELRLAVLAALGWHGPAAEIGAMTKPLLTKACKKLIVAWLASQTSEESL